MGQVTLTAARLLERAVKDSGRRTTVQIPEEFARISAPGDDSTPLSRLFLQGEVVLKLYLTMLLLTRKPPHDLFRTYVDQYWANLFGFEERTEANPRPGAGTRRVRRAMKVLRDPDSPVGQLLTTRIEKGVGPVVQVVHPTGAIQAPYITLPLELWSNGWINVMTARALYVYVCLRLLLGNNAQAKYVSVWDREGFAMSDDTWHRGVAELERLGLVSSTMDTVKSDDWSQDLRPRRVHSLELTTLVNDKSPLEPAV